MQRNEVCTLGKNRLAVYVKAKAASVFIFFPVKEKRSQTYALFLFVGGHALVGNYACRNGIKRLFAHCVAVPELRIFNNEAAFHVFICVNLFGSAVRVREGKNYACFFACFNKG